MLGLTTLPRIVYYFECSSKRKNEFMDFCKFIEVEYHEMLNMCLLAGLVF